MFTAAGAMTEETIVSGCELNPTHADRYSMANIETGRCDLVVLSASNVEAGMYKCASFDPTASAQLAVLGIRLEVRTVN